MIRPRTLAQVATALLAVLCVGLGLGGCYRAARPAELGETVRVVVVANDARLVRAQAYLQAEVAEALEHRLGWRVSPTGSARLELSMAREDIDAPSSDRRDIPARWSITLRGAMLLASAKGQAAAIYTGVGYASGTTDEPEALRQAARNAAAEISAWLENTVPNLPAQ